MARCRSGGVAFSVLVHTDMSSPWLTRYGTEAQKRTYLPGIVAGETVCALGITEPGTGSDMAALATRAVREGDVYRLTGRKIFITNGVYGDLYFVAARTGPGTAARRHDGISMFLVERGRPGFTVSRTLDKMGMRASDTAELSFQDCPVPAENLLGVEGRGLQQLAMGLQRERIMAAVLALSGAQQALEDTVNYLHQRTAFGEPLAARLTAPLQAFVRDPASLVPVGDEVFRAYRQLYDYDPTPLEARVEWVNDRNPAWREELVTVRAAYGAERLPLHVYVPKSASPPYQVVIVFPGSNAVRTRSSQSLDLRMSDFHVRAGRMLVYPIYQGTYERLTPGPKGMKQRRDIMIQRGKDIRRAIDYLATRPDADTTKVAFYGISLGAQLAPLFLGIEPRFRLGVIFSGGFETWDMPAECDPVNFAPRVRAPVLMVNGREDFDLPYESAQVPMFQMLGTAPDQKQHVVLAGGHIPLHREAAIRAMSEWLDLRFGAPR